MILTRTPMRISLFGGGTDYPEWYMPNGGAVLGVTIDKYCYVALHKSGQIWKCFDLPIRSGVATSSAFTVGLLRASTDFDKTVLARLAVEWERDKSGGNVGHQDQYLCALGGMLNLKFCDQGVEVNPIDSNGLQDNLMLFYTGVRHTGSYDVIEEQLSNIKQTAPVLKEMHSLVYDGIDALDKGSEFGKLLDKTWGLKRKLAEHISTPEIDSVYDKALRAGAIGGKLLGAGNGGFMLLYVERDRQDDVEKAIGLARVPFKFEDEGTQVIYRENDD